MGAPRGGAATDGLSINTLIEVRCVEGPPRSGRVEDVDGRIVCVSVSSEQFGRHVPAPVDTSVCCSWLDPTSLWTQEAEVLGETGDDRRWWRLQTVGSPRRLQRRDAFRVELGEPVTMTFEDVEHAAVLLDLSATGVGLEVVDPPDVGVGARITVELMVADAPTTFACEVTRVDPQDDGRPGEPRRLMLGARFLDVPHAVAEALGAHVIQLQLAQLRQRDLVRPGT